MSNKFGDYLFKGAGITLIGAVIAFFAVLFSTNLPIMLSSESSDFGIIVQPIDIFATPLESDTSPSVLKMCNPPEFDHISKLQSAPANFIEVQNTVYFGISQYKYPVDLKIASSNPNIFIYLNSSTQIPDFKTQMYVYVKPVNTSIIHYPVIIQGVGGNGKIRNCTFYVTYKTPQDVRV